MSGILNQRNVRQFEKHAKTSSFILKKPAEANKADVHAENILILTKTEIPFLVILITFSGHLRVILVYAI